MKSSFSKWSQVILLVTSYWACSIGLTFYNRHLFHHFDAPIASTTCHFFITFALCGFTRKVRQCVTGHNAILLGWSDYAKKLIPTGLISALDIGLSNWSLVYITVPLYTMVKSTSILFILFFALILRLEKMRWSLVIVTILISTGLFLFVFQMTQFNWFGFILVISAAATGGLRWTLSQMLTQKQELGLGNPMDFLFHLQPAMVFGMLPLLLYHGYLPFLSTRQLFAAEVTSDFVQMSAKIVMGGVLAFALGMTEYLLVAKTSSLTFALSGIVKELVTMLVAEFSGDQKLTLLNWAGFTVCISGIALHAVLKIRSKSDVEMEDGDETELGEATNPLITNVSSDEEEIFNTATRSNKF